MSQKLDSRQIALPPSSQSPVPTLISELPVLEVDSLRTSSQHEGLLRWHQLAYPNRPWLADACIHIELMLLSGGVLGRAYGAYHITVQGAKVVQSDLQSGLFSQKSIAFEGLVVLADEQQQARRFDLDEFSRLVSRLTSIASRVTVPLRNDEASIFESFCYSVRSYLNVHTTTRK